MSTNNTRRLRMQLRRSIIPCALLLAAAGAHAQEALVPVDEEGKVERIDQTLERKLGLFPTFEEFQHAELYMLPDSTYALEVYYRTGGRPVKQRTPMTAADVATFRHRVSEAIALQAPEVPIDQDGRTTLVTASTIYGLGYYGWAVPTILDVDETKTAVALYMVTSGASFFVPYLLTRNTRVTDADAALSVGAGHLGMAHGVFVNLLINGREADLQGTLAYGMTMSIGEMIAGYYLADRNNMGTGKAMMIYFGGMEGTGIGLGTAYLADLFYDGGEPGIATMTLVGAGLGYLGGNALANMQPYTAGDAQVSFTSSLLGAYIPFAIIGATGGDFDSDGKAFVGGAIGGSLAGFGAGHFLLKGKDFSTGDGSLVMLGTVAGGLLGTGVAYLLSSDAGDNTSLYYSASALGGVGGFGLMYSLLSDRARRTETGSLWRFNVAPEGIAAYALRDKIQLPKRMSVPLLQVEGRF